MTIKSHFLPDNALQGEEIPTFILWRDIDYDKIEVSISNCCEIKEYYNVNEKNVEIFKNKVIISSVEVDGYLGILFNTERTSELLVESEISYTFVKDNEIVDNLKCNMVLFKPELKIQYVPDEIKIENSLIEDKEKIVLGNIGEGTCRIKFVTTENSGIQIQKPKRFREFIEGFSQTFDEEVDNVSAKYENYEYVFEDAKYLINTVFDPGDEELLKEFNTRIERLDNAFEMNENLLKDIIRIYIFSLLKNISMITVMEQFLDYLRSVEKNGVRLLNALDSISVNKGINMIELEIRYTDLLNSKINPIKLKPINIISDNEVEISIFNLFRWLEVEEI